MAQLTPGWNQALGVTSGKVGTLIGTTVTG